MSDIPTYLPAFLLRLWPSYVHNGDRQRMHIYDVLEDRLSETHGTPKTTRDIFQDFSDEDDSEDEAETQPNPSFLSVPQARSLTPPIFAPLHTSLVSSSFPSLAAIPAPAIPNLSAHQRSEEETAFHDPLRAARVAFRKLEQEVENVLDRILPFVAISSVAAPADEKQCDAATTSRTTNTSATNTTHPTTDTITQLVISSQELDMLRRYFTFLRFRNSYAYVDMLYRMSWMCRNRQYEQPEQGLGHGPGPETATGSESEAGPEIATGSGSEAGSETATGPESETETGTETATGPEPESGHVFLAEAALFLGMHPIEMAYLEDSELWHVCWQLRKAQISFSLAPPQVEYLLAEQLLGSLDDVGADTNLPSFFFPVSPTTALCIMGQQVNEPGPMPGQMLVNCVHEQAEEVHIRNAAMVLRNGSRSEGWYDDGCRQSVYFLSPSAAAESLAWIKNCSSNGQYDGSSATITVTGSGDGSNGYCWYDRLRKRCLKKAGIGGGRRKARGRQ